MPGSSGCVFGSLGDALRALVHAEIGADAVAGAVVVVEADLPQRAARKRVELRAGGARRESAHSASAMWPFSTRVKRSRISGARLADRDGAGDVGGAVEILRAGIDQIERARFERASRSPASRGNARSRRSARRPRWSES